MRILILNAHVRADVSQHTIYALGYASAWKVGPEVRHNFFFSISFVHRVRWYPPFIKYYGKSYTICSTSFAKRNVTFLNGPLEILLLFIFIHLRPCYSVPYDYWLPEPKRNKTLSRQIQFLPIFFFFFFDFFFLVFGGRRKLV